VIRTAEEVRRAEEEALRKKEEEERQAREKAEEEAREEERIRKENSFWNKGWKKLKNLGETILGPEEE
jgi:cell division protein FtsA